MDYGWSLEKEIFKHDQALIYDIKLSDKGDELLVAATNGSLYRVDLTEPDNYDSLFVKEENLFSTAYSPDGQYILTGNGNGIARLWHHSGDLVQEYIGEQNTNVWEVDMTDDNRYVITAGQDQAVKKWSTSGLLLNRYGELTQLEDAMSWYHDNELFECKLPYKAGQPVVLTISGTEKDGIPTFMEPYGICQGPNHLTIMDWDNKRDLSILYVYLKKNQSWRSLGLMQYEGSAYTLHPTRPLLTYFNLQGVGVQWNLDSNKLLPLDTGFHLQKKNAKHVAMAYTPDGKHLVYGSTGTIMVYDCGNGLPKYEKMLKGRHDENKFISHFSFHQEKQLMASGSQDGTVVLWHFNDFSYYKKLVAPIRAGWVSHTAFSPDGKHVLVAYQSGVVYLFRIADGFVVQEFRVLNQESAAAFTCAFSPDGQQVVVQYEKGYTRIWEIRESLESFLRRGDFDGLTDVEKEQYGIK